MSSPPATASDAASANVADTGRRVDEHVAVNSDYRRLVPAAPAGALAAAAGVVHRRVCWEGPVFELGETLP